MEKTTEYLRARLGVNDMLDGELHDFQDILNDDDNTLDETVEPLSNAEANRSQNDNEVLMVNGRAFDALSGFNEFTVEV